jgi:hypothetical protein
MAGAIAGSQIGLARTLRKIKNAGATSEETAKTASELCLRSDDLKRLKRWIKETSDGRFYVECKDGKHC